MKKVIKPKVEKEEYELEDKDYLLINAINELASAIRMLKLG